MGRRNSIRRETQGIHPASFLVRITAKVFKTVAARMTLHLKELLRPETNVKQVQALKTSLHLIFRQS